MNKKMLLLLTSWFYREEELDVMTIDKLVNTNNALVYDIYCYTLKSANVENSIDGFFTMAVNVENVSIIERNANSLVFKFEEEIFGIFYKSISDIIVKNHDYIFDKSSSFEAMIKNNHIQKQQKNDNQLPIPSHLQEILMPTKQNDLQITGNLKCLCGNETFEVKQSNDEYAGYAVQCICGHCKKTYLVFDSQKHGWDGYVGRKFSQSAEAIKWNHFCCDECNSNKFHVDITISSQGKNDFCHELKDEIKKGFFSEEEWIEAFDWITIIVTCAECKKNFLEFVNYETM